MRGFHNLLKEKKPSMLMFLGCSLISLMSLVMLSMHLDFFGEDTGVI
jgi:hypothetical protein